MRSASHADGRIAKPQDATRLCRSLFEASPLPTSMMVGTHHIVRYVNPAFCRMVGKSKDEVTGVPFANLIHDDHCLPLLDRVLRMAEPETHTQPGESETLTGYWSYVIWPIIGANELPAGIIFQVTETARFHRRSAEMNQELLLSGVRQHELTDRAERLNVQLQREMAKREGMERALVVSEKLAATARLAHTMAHEINNPLGAITNLVYLLAPLQTIPEAQAFVTMLEDQLKGLTHIATQMLKFHRDSSRPTEFKLRELVSETLEVYRLQAESQGVLLRQRLETDGVVVGFRSEIMQVISNLLLNALDAMPAGGQVTVHLYPAPPWLCEIHRRCGFCLFVADTGTGIATEHYGRIFEPFFTTKGDKGSGLGLWLCTSIVNRAGGSIRVWSTRRAGCSGTCFLVFLPAEEGSPTPLRRRYERRQNKLKIT
jgi:PAS domain S-box-containing protein